MSEPHVGQLVHCERCKKTARIAVSPPSPSVHFYIDDVDGAVICVTCKAGIQYTRAFGALNDCEGCCYDVVPADAAAQATLTDDEVRGFR